MCCGLVFSAAGRTLLLCWPLNAEHQEQHGDWDDRCLQHFHGDTVIYVGEWNMPYRATVCNDSPADVTSIGDVEAAEKARAQEQREACAVGRSQKTTSSQAFQRRLLSEYTLLRRVELPTWLHCSDDLTIWKRRVSVVAQATSNLA